MDILSEAYYKSAAENERNLRFWENYLQSLKNLDFSLFSVKLKVPALVPIGSRILFRGELKHTNEVIIALGADHFVKCSLKQAEILRQHRMKDAQSKIDLFNKEKQYLENQMSFRRKSIYDNAGKEMIEYYSEEDDKAWREKHRENVRQYNQNKSKEKKNQMEDVIDEELWNRLEELELQEELENELYSMNDDSQALTKIKETKNDFFIVKEEEEIIKIKNKEDEERYIEKTEENEIKSDKKVIFKEINTTQKTSKMDVLQQVINKQNELETKLMELKNREKGETKSESDLISRLDELEQLDEFEDEMDRLDDIILNENVEDDNYDGDSNKIQAPKLQRRVSFVDADDREVTLEIPFKHCPVELNNEPYDPKKGIQKPSDIYEAHSNCFGNATTSILKKSKYGPMTEEPERKASSKEKVEQFNAQDSKEHDTIVIKDVVEKVNQVDNKLQSQARPTSLFKKKRMQNKS